MTEFPVSFVTRMPGSTESSISSIGDCEVHIAISSYNFTKSVVATIISSCQYNHLHNPYYLQKNIHVAKQINITFTITITILLDIFDTINYPHREHDQVDGGEDEETAATLRRKVAELEAALAQNHRGGREVDNVLISTTIMKEMQIIIRIQSVVICKENNNEPVSDFYV